MNKKFFSSGSAMANKSNLLKFLSGFLLIIFFDRPVKASQNQNTSKQNFLLTTVILSEICKNFFVKNPYRQNAIPSSIGRMPLQTNNHYLGPNILCLQPYS
jgi:hypothetical protein